MAKKHKLKYALHCGDCFEKAAMNMWNYYGSKEWMEEEKARYNFMDRVNKMIMAKFERIKK